MTDKIVKFSDLTYYDSKIKQYINNQNLILITHSELVALRDNSQLVPGQWYQITDFYTTTCQPHTRSIGVRYDILLMAISENRFAVDAITAPHDFHVDATTHLSSEINPFTGVAYSLTDEEGDIVDGVWDAPVNWFDNHIIKYKIDINDTQWVDYPNYPYRWYGTEKFIWVTSDGGTTKKRYQYVGSQDIGGTTYYEWSAYNQVYTLSATPSASDTLYDNTGTAISDTLMKYIELAPKGIVTYMEDLWDNKVGYDFHSIQFERDVDFIATYGNLYLKNTNSFTVLTATDGYYFTFNVWGGGKLKDASEYSIWITNENSKWRCAFNNTIPSRLRINYASNPSYGGWYWLPENIMFRVTYGNLGLGITEFAAIKDNIFSTNTYSNTFATCMGNIIQCKCNNNVVASFTYNTIKANFASNAVNILQFNILNGVAINSFKGYSFCNNHVNGTFRSCSNGEFVKDSTIINDYYIENNLFNMTCRNVTINCTMTLSQLNDVWYTDITYLGSGICGLRTINHIVGTNNSHKTIALVDTTNESQVGENSNGDIVQWNPADLATPMSATQVNNVINQI